MTSPTPNTATVSNTSCLIALETIARLDLLPRLYQGVLIPQAVAREWGSAIPVWMTVQIIRDQTPAQALGLQLGPGEAEAITLAVEVGAKRLILDDQRARHVATNLQVTITGTVGIVLRAKKRSMVPLVGPVFDELRNAGFWLSDKLCQQALQLAGE